LYSNSFWRVVCKKGLWLKPASLMRSAKYNQVANQKIHQMSSGQLRQMLAYKGGCQWFCKRSATRRRSAYAVQTAYPM